MKKSELHDYVYKNRARLTAMMESRDALRWRPIKSLAELETYGPAFGCASMRSAMWLFTWDSDSNLSYECADFRIRGEGGGISIRTTNGKHLNNWRFAFVNERCVFG